MTERFKARMMVEKPDEIEMTLKLTMNMKDWDALRAQLTTGYPSWKLTQAINLMMENAKKIYYAEETPVS